MSTNKEKEQQERAAALNARAVKLAEEAVDEARKAKGWRKWVYLALAALAGGIAYFTAGCTASVSQAADGSWQYTGVIVLPVEEGGK